MEIRIYKPSLELIGIIENHTSLMWVRRFDAAGEYELRCPITQYNVSLLKRGNIVSYPGATEAGIIEHLQLDANGFAETMTVKGRFLTAIFDWMITSAENTTGDTGNGIMTFSVYNKKPAYIYPAMLNTAYAQYCLPSNFELGGITAGGGSITFQATAKNMLTYFGKIGEACGVGFEVRPDWTARKMRLEVYEGVDRSKAQSDRTRIIFSSQFDNLTRISYTENDQLYRNTCLVGGQGEADQREWAVAYESDQLTSGMRMTSYNASGVSKEDDTYKALLAESGLAYLRKSCQLSTSFECTVKPTGNFNYRADYDLGDIVTVEKTEWGISHNLRITEVQENYAHGEPEIEITLGTPLSTTMDWSDN